MCEKFACVIENENAFRDAECPDAGHIYCECPFDIADCEGNWTCDDIK